MPRTIEPIPYTPEPAPNRKLWTRRECDFLRDNGLLSGRYELIDGEVLLLSGPQRGEFAEMGHKRPHAIAVVLLIQWLIAVFGGDHVQCQLPINVAEEENETNEPEPDAAVFRQPVTAYTENHPGPEDLLLVVEVSDATLHFDRSTKAALYARAGIGEFWIVDVVGRQIFVHRQPTPEGYTDIAAYGAEERIATLVRPDAFVAVMNLLPPA